MSKTTHLYGAVRAIGTIKPKFNAQQQGFEAPTLDVVGTGFWVAGPTGPVFVTCAHVIKDLISAPIQQVGMLVVGGNQQQYAKASIDVVDFEHDLAVLKVQEPVSPQCLVLPSQPLSTGDDIAYAGFPLGNQLLNEKHTPSYAEGVIGSEVETVAGKNKVVQISGSVVGGYSGSPIVLADHPEQVIGVISRHPTETQNIILSVHWMHIAALVGLSNS